jgi:hypothetical protein
MTSQLEALVGSLLSVESPDAKEFAGLKNSGLKRLNDASNTANSKEGRFDLAYNAAHALCLAALRYRGYRPQKRYVVFQALPHTLGIGAEVWRIFDKWHHLRNRAEYEGELDIDDRILADLIKACRTVASKLDSLPPLS